MDHPSARTVHGMKHVNPHYRRGITTSKKELTDLAKAWLLLGLAFAIAMSGFSLTPAFFLAVMMSLGTIGIGFLFHELAHKFVAQRFGCFAEFRSFDTMLFLAIAMSFFGFIFAAPGAVMIQGHLTRRQNGIISAAGPAMNILVALVFFSLTFATAGIIAVIGFYGFTINAFLAMFNMIPFAMFDGRKVWDWNKGVYVALAATSLLMVFGQGLISAG